MDYTIGSNESVSMAIVRAVSALNNCDPRSMRPLTTAIDPDALDTLFAARSDEEPRPGGRVSFVWEHCRVSVDNDEYLTVEPIRIRHRTAGDGQPDVAGAP